VPCLMAVIGKQRVLEPQLLGIAAQMSAQAKSFPKSAFKYFCGMDSVPKPRRVKSQPLMLPFMRVG